jgi:DNA-binding NarL/FixJ family response regulator
MSVRHDLAGVDRLTERECELLQAFADGFTSPAIAKEWDISVQTVRTYKERIFVKLGCHYITEAVAIAWRGGKIA